MENSDIAKSIDRILQTPNIPGNIAFMLCRLRSEIDPSSRINVPQFSIFGETWIARSIDNNTGSVNIMRISNGEERVMSLRSYKACIEANKEGQS